MYLDCTELHKKYKERIPSFELTQEQHRKHVSANIFDRGSEWRRGEVMCWEGLQQGVSGPQFGLDGMSRT